MEAVLTILNGLGLAALVTLAFSAIISRSSRNLQVIRLGLGVMLGFASVVSMLEPISIGGGYIFDVRYAPIALAAAFGGWPAALITAAMAAAYRLHLGGAGMYAGLLGIIIVFTASVVCARLLRDREIRRTRDVLPFAAVTSLSLFSLLILPLDQALALLQSGAAPVMVGNFLGALLYGTFLLRELRRHTLEMRLISDAITDPLTGLPNRRAFYQKINEMVDHGVPVSVAIFDVDNFKQINDAHGHKVGDETLVTISRALREVGRSTDFVARIAGDEFAAILPIASPDGFAIAADRMRRAVEKCVIATPDGGRVQASVSIGVAQSPSDGHSVDTLMAAADSALYGAKRDGRNRVRLATVLHPERQAS